MFEYRQLDATVSALASVGVVPAASPVLVDSAEAVLAELRDYVVADVPAFQASGNPAVLPELGQHVGDHVREICRLFGGSIRGDFAFVRIHARKRARQKFPLESTLHAYRCGHKILARWMREAALATANPDAHVQKVIAYVADFAIEYTNIISSIITAEYVAETRRISEAEGDARNELLDTLLHGYDESDSRIERLLRRAGYLEQRLSFCVAVAQSIDPVEMESIPRAQRIADAILHALAELPCRTLTGIRDNVVVAVVSDTRRMSGWTRPQATLADQVFPAMMTLGPAVLIGMSTDQPSTSYIPRALQEARIAIDFASVGERVVQFAQIPIRRMMLRIARDNIQSALPVWIDAFLEADRRANGKLTKTLLAYADANMNAQGAAKQLSVHPNTIYSRVHRIEELTGLNALNYHELTEILLAAECRDS